MTMKVIGGGDLPPGLGEALAEALSGGMRQHKVRPALLQDVRGLLEAANQPKFQVGDIVRLRPFAENNFRWPKADERCIVTQVLDQPYRCGEHGTKLIGRPMDIALAFVDDEDGELMEYLHDSRHFEKVGSIYDPVTLADGEVLPVE